MGPRSDYVEEQQTLGRLVDRPDLARRPCRMGDKPPALTPRQRAAAAAIAASRPAPPRPPPAGAAAPATEPRSGSLAILSSLVIVRAVAAASLLALFALVIGGGALSLPFAVPGAPLPPASASLSLLATSLIAGRVDAQSGAEAAAAASLCLLFAAGAMPLCLGGGDALALGGLVTSALSIVGLEAIAALKQ